MEKLLEQEAMLDEDQKVSLTSTSSPPPCFLGQEATVDAAAEVKPVPLPPRLLITGLSERRLSLTSCWAAPRWLRISAYAS